MGHKNASSVAGSPISRSAYQSWKSARPAAGPSTQRGSRYSGQSFRERAIKDTDQKTTQNARSDNGIAPAKCSNSAMSARNSESGFASAADSMGKRVPSG